MTRYGDHILAKVKARQAGEQSTAKALQPVVSHNGGNVFNCFVPGDPQSQGGTVPLRNPITGKVAQVTTGSKGLAQWRKVMTSAFGYARKQTRHETIDGPCSLSAVFIMPRLAGHPKTKQGRYWADTSLDLDKLLRALNDSLQKAGVYTNDSRICGFRYVGKRYAALEETPGVLVTVTPLDPDSTLEQISPQAAAGLTSHNAKGKEVI